MALIDRMFDNARVRLPGAVDPMLRNELWNVVDDFCRESLAWREVIEVALSIGDATYTPTPTGTQIVQIISTHHETLDLNGAIWVLNTLTLATAPTATDAAEPMYITAALTVDPTVSQASNDDVDGWLPEDVWKDNYDCLQEGLLGRMFGQPAKPYSNPQMALWHLRNYRSKRSEARQRVRTGNQPGARTWRFPRWA